MKSYVVSRVSPSPGKGKGLLMLVQFLGSNGMQLNSYSHDKLYTRILFGGGGGGGGRGENLSSCDRRTES